MNQGFTSVPFKTESEHGLTSYNGVAKFSPAGVVLEFESKILGMIPGGVKEVRLPIGEILDIKFKKGFFRLGAKIVIRTRTFAVLAAMPNKDGRVSLKLIREDFDLGMAAVEQIQKEMAGIAEQLPPPHSPVGQLFADESEDETKRLLK
jgi:hypothetical protein